MQTILLVILRQPVAEVLIQKLREVTDIRLIYEPDYFKFFNTADNCGADTILIEVQETGDYGMTFCLTLCGRLRKEAPGRRVILLCPEQDATCVSDAVKAMRDGSIDDFLFFNATIDYMVSKLLAM
jgi:hypothetical protein